MGRPSFTRPPGTDRFGDAPRFGETRRPGRMGYFLAAAILVMSVGAFVPLLLRAIRTIADADMHRMVAPGSAEFTLSEAGSYTIFHEYRSVHEGRTYSGGEAVGLSITLARVDDGSEIPLEPSDTKTSYSYGSRSGASLTAFDLDRPGPVVLTAKYPDATIPGVETVLAVGRIDIPLFVVRLLVAIGVSLGGVLLAVGVFVVTLIRRNRTYPAGGAPARRRAGLDTGPAGR